MWRCSSQRSHGQSGRRCELARCVRNGAPDGVSSFRHLAHHAMAMRDDLCRPRLLAGLRGRIWGRDGRRYVRRPTRPDPKKISLPRNPGPGPCAERAEGPALRSRQHRGYAVHIAKIFTATLKPARRRGSSPRIVLHHGTTSFRWRSMMREDRLRIAPTGVRVVSMTTEWKVAAYFARNSLAADLSEIGRSKANEAVVLTLDAKTLFECGYPLIRFSDPIWDRGKCDWEREVACLGDIQPLSAVLISVRTVSPAGTRGRESGSSSKSRGGSL